MALKDVKDLVIRYPGHPKYQEGRIVEDDEVEVIVQKLEMILFTNRGEVLGNPDIGANLEYIGLNGALNILRKVAPDKEQEVF